MYSTYKCTRHPQICNLNTNINFGINLFSDRAKKIIIYLIKIIKILNLNLNWSMLIFHFFKDKHETGTYNKIGPIAM